MLKNLIWIFSFSASFFASLLGLTLKPIRIAFEAFARVTSVSVITPIFDKIIFGVTSGCLIFSMAVFIASLEPWTSDLTIIANSFGVALSLKNESLFWEEFSIDFTWDQRNNDI